MSYKVSKRVWTQCEQRGGARLVMLALAECCTDAGHCFPSIPTIAGMAMITERAAFGIINRLEADGEIEIKAGRGRGNKSSYNLPRYAVKPEQKTGITGSRKPEPDARKPEPDAENLNMDASHIEEPSLGTIKEPSGSSGSAAPTTARASRSTGKSSKPKGTSKADNPEDRAGPFREVFRAICQVRRLNPDILSEADAGNTRRLTGTLCRAGVTDPEKVKAWARDWYADIAKRFGIAQSEVTPPTLAQLTTAFGARIAPAEDPTSDAEIMPDGKPYNPYNVKHYLARKAAREAAAPPPRFEAAL